jgi:elongation factor Ts
MAKAEFKQEDVRMAVSASMVKELRDRTGLGMMECKKALNEANGDIDLAIEEMRKSSGMKAAKKAGRTAADGVVTTKVAEDGSYGVIVEVNSETDFAAREPGFLAFAALVTDKVFASKETDIAVLMAGELETAREALVQKIGENISVRRAVVVTATDGVVDGYVHSNNRIAVLVALKNGDAELARDVAMHVAAVNPRVAKSDEMPAEEITKERDIFTAQAAESGKPAEIIEKMIDGRIRKFLSENSLVDQAFVKDPELTVGTLLKNSGADIQGFIRFEVGEGIEKQVVDFAAEVAAQLKG